MGTRVTVQNLISEQDNTELNPSPTSQTIDLSEHLLNSFKAESVNKLIGIAIQVRRKTASQWIDNKNTDGTPIQILPGELCYATDTGELKVGNNQGTAGLSEGWASLPNIMGLSNRLTLDENNYKYLTIDDGDLDVRITSPSS